MTSRGAKATMKETYFEIDARYVSVLGRVFARENGEGKRMRYRAADYDDAVIGGLKMAHYAKGADFVPAVRFYELKVPAASPAANTDESGDE